MAKNSKIEWTDHTANIWHGCAKVHCGCEHCYAEDLALSWGLDIWGNDKPRKAIKSVWTDLADYQRTAKQNGRMDRVFVGSMQDIFEKTMPLIDWNGRPLPYTTDVLRRKLFQKIHWRMYPNLLFLFLTKRPPNINKYIPPEWKTKPPANVMFGCSVSDQETADLLIPQLLTVNGNLFLSVEPQLGLVHLTRYLSTGRIPWVIQGGESGPFRRTFNLEWGYQMAADCKAHGVAFFFKQVDKVISVPKDLLIREFPQLKDLRALA